jgi:hypothetical protein
MSISLLFTDLRSAPSRLEKHNIEWKPRLTAKQTFELTLGPTLADDIEKDLHNNSRELIVSWYNKRSNEISEIGGVGTVNWAVPDDTVITVSYENERTTQEQIDESIEWTLKQEL